MGLTTPREDLRTLYGIIYRIYNTMTGMSYIGQTQRTFYKRYRGKWWNRVGNSYIRRAVKKYGPEAFYVETLEHSLPKERLDEREIYWIHHFGSVAPNGYNLHLGGKRHEVSEVMRRKATRQTRDRNRKEYVLIKDDKEYRFDIIAVFARKMGLCKEGVSCVLKGKYKTHRGYHLPGADLSVRRKDQRLRHLVKDGITYNVHSLKDFAREHGLRVDVIGQLFRGTVRMHRGFHIPNPPPYKTHQSACPTHELSQ